MKNRFWIVLNTKYSTMYAYERTLVIFGARHEVLCELHIYRAQRDEQKVITFSFDGWEQDECLKSLNYKYESYAVRGANEELEIIVARLYHSEFM